MTYILLAFMLYGENESLSSAYYTVRDLYAEYSAAICSAKVSHGRRQDELFVLYSQYSAEIVRNIAGGELSSREIQLLGALPPPELACESQADRERREEEQAFFDPENQLKLYCLPREERIAILQERIPEAHREVMQVYFDRWEDRSEKTFGHNRERLCRNHEPIPAVARGVS